MTLVGWSVPVLERIYVVADGCVQYACITGQGHVLVPFQALSVVKKLVLWLDRGEAVNVVTAFRMCVMVRWGRDAAHAHTCQRTVHASSEHANRGSAVLLSGANTYTRFVSLCDGVDRTHE